MKLSPLYTDYYQLAMAQVYFKSGQHELPATFDYFFRKLPYQGGYAVFAGLENILETLESISFSQSDLDYLKLIQFDDDFLHYLSEFSFSGDVRSMAEGEMVFSNIPILQVEAPIAEAQIVETVILNTLNFQTLIATKARRMREAAGAKTLLDFGLRRAQGFGGLHASRAAIIGGFDGSSNVLSGKEFDISVSGTMAHSFIQSYENELDAFRDFAKYNPENTVLLVDTYDTLKIGVPNAIKVAKEMEEQGNQLKGIRLDSGDLAYLAKQSRKMLDDAGLDYVKIAASNQLDEYLIKSLKEQRAPIDVFGVGTNLMTGQPDSALDGVYKLAEFDGIPKIKISENTEKTTLPGKKQVWRVHYSDGSPRGADVIALGDETEISTMHHPVDITKMLNLEDCKLFPMLHSVMENGERVHKAQTVGQIKDFSEKKYKQLPDEFKRFDYPHEFKVGVSKSLLDLRNELIEATT